MLEKAQCWRVGLRLEVSSIVRLSSRLLLHW
jgi:hypothetical protein